MNLVHQPLLIGAWIGLLHAFDADHISTLSSLAVRDRPRSALGYATRWACGHAIAIGLLGMLAIGLGMLWISNLSHVAELLVAGLLIALGASTVWSARHLHGPPRAGAAGKQNANVQNAQNANVRHRRTGLLMGLLHGGAGSAAVLALMPLTGFDSRLAAAGFLLTFSAGVATGALIFAAAFSRLMQKTRQTGTRVGSALAILVGIAAIVIGATMLLETFYGR